MASLSEFVYLVSSASPVRRIQLLSVVVVSILAFTAIFYSGLMGYTAPDPSRLMAIEGRVAGYPGSWKHNRSLVHFGVSYKLDGLRVGKPIYVPREQYEQSGLRINSKVLLTVERLEDGSMVRELATADGRILYDDRLHQQVVGWNNESIKFTVVASVFMAIGFAIAALVTVVRHRREIFQTD